MKLIFNFNLEEHLYADLLKCWWPTSICYRIFTAVLLHWMVYSYPYFYYSCFSTAIKHCQTWYKYSLILIILKASASLWYFITAVQLLLHSEHFTTVIRFHFDVATAPPMGNCCTHRGLVSHCIMTCLLWIRNSNACISICSFVTCSHQFFRRWFIIAVDAKLL